MAHQLRVIILKPSKYMAEVLAAWVVLMKEQK
jgi:hypothetical protein